MNVNNFREMEKAFVQANQGSGNFFALQQRDDDQFAMLDLQAISARI